MSELTEIGMDGNVENKVKRPVRIGTYWKRPPTKTYKDNFGFGVNGYQPMIDYMDEKDLGGGTPKGKVYLPFLEERCMRKYAAEKPFKLYTNKDIDHFIDKGNNIVREIRLNDATGIGNTLNRTHTNWSMSKKWVQLVKQSTVVDFRKLRADREAEENAVLPPSNCSIKSSGRRSLASVSRSPSRPRLTSVRDSPARQRLTSVTASPSRCSRSPTRVSSRTTGRDHYDKMVNEYEDVLSMLAHSKIDHENLMVSRRERLQALDDQFEDVIGKLSKNLSNITKRAERTESGVATGFEGCQTREDVMNATDDIAFQNQLRRRQQLLKMVENVDQLTNADESKARLNNNLRHLDDDIYDMNERLSNLTRRHRSEREADVDAITSLTQTAAALAARQKQNRFIDPDDVDDSDVRYLRNRSDSRRSTSVETVEKIKPKRKHLKERYDTLSEVQARVISRASTMTDRSHAVTRINNRARFINIYKPKPDTCDPDLIVKPSRTEINIDSMAKSFVEGGNFKRRYAIDDEVDPPVSNLNTNAHNTYHLTGQNRPISYVPSNSSRVRYAVIRARARNSILNNN